MKSTFTTKLLQHLSKKKQEGGFTLIELLVVIIIIGILAAIALPSFLNQANKAKQSEAKTYVGSMNRAQQAYYLENDSFAGDSAEEFGALGLGIDVATDNYDYSIVEVTTDSNGGINSAMQKADPSTDTLKVYIGGVETSVVATTNEATTVALLCEAKEPPLVTGAPDGASDAVADYFTDLDGTDTEADCLDADFKSLGN